MDQSIRRPRRVAILSHPQVKEQATFPDEVGAFLEARGVQVTQLAVIDEGFASSLAAEDLDMLVALGGDGTMLKASYLAGPHHIPIMGVKLGRLGFLVEVAKENWQQALERVLEGDFRLESRMRLHAEVARGEQILGSWEALNECVLGRGEILRPVRLTAEIDGRQLTSYVADALICATATGSTAYALAAGGPILPPELRNLLLVPVAPHMSLDRAVVLPEGSEVRIIVDPAHEATLGIDGAIAKTLQGGDELRVRASDSDIYFVRLQDPGYFFRNLTSHMNHFPSGG